MTCPSLTMKRFTGVLLLILILAITFSQPAFARSGCCSHHGGVSGCGCADGSPLSSTCAPYYPQCTGSFTAIVQHNYWPAIIITSTIVGGFFWNKKRREKNHSERQNNLHNTSQISCDRCGASMILRSGKYGKFYGCSRYPNCRGTKSIKP